MTDTDTGRLPDEEIGSAYGADDGGATARSATRDAVSVWMLRSVLLLLVVVLVGAVSLIFYILSMRGAPRTQNERDITSFETAVKEHPKVAQNWVELAYAYAGAKRWSQALSTLREARRSHNGDPLIDIAEADTLRLAGRYDEALKGYDAAERSSVAEWNRQKKKENAKQIEFDRPNPYLVEVEMGRGITYTELKRPKEALAAFRAAAKLDPQNAFALASIGDRLMDLGKPQDAEAAYMEALDYVPDYTPALEGISRIREGK